MQPDDFAPDHAHRPELPTGRAPGAAEAAAPDIRVVIVVDPDLPPGLLANTVATISIGLGAAMPGLAGGLAPDAQGCTLRTSANRPVPILRGTTAVIGALLGKAHPIPEGACVVPFPRFARSIHDYAAYERELANRDVLAEPMEGLGLAGPSRWVRSLTGSLGLLR
ncbi:DUF2000 domain-containing protein [Frateuria defendens]|uniref:DUF2000 domain-containing protein n=1 Tax=Frateuria defendens TaxID=2219559 RepID=UPI0009E43FE2|nr:DUF2000 domain-containing protein [Frateuria defendens]